MNKLGWCFNGIMWGFLLNVLIMSFEKLTFLQWIYIFIAPIIYFIITYRLLYDIKEEVCK